MWLCTDITMGVIGGLANIDPFTTMFAWCVLTIITVDLLPEV